MNNSVVIKGNKHGIVVVLDANMEFSELKEHIATKFRDSAKFLGNAKMAISFEGKKLTDAEQREVLDIIAENSDLYVVCIVDNDPEKDAVFEKSLNDKLLELSNTTGQFYKGNLRSGQVLETETSIIVIGDVNPGASVISKGNIIVLGALKGTVFAGATGNENAFVLALDMYPVQIRIADTIARCPDNPIKDENKEAKIAFLEEGNIYIEPVNRKVLNEIRL
ncbi:septum site-determining protein MinC [Clostridium sp. Marseille-P299]|uniref:septum site-determining protein MinC n=1 Tax=Clostridium sp. Marseille-P299 TaxID=1805477 RepID=UPI00082F1235|nr:septum site-determining protein MinC [Clostridium sp. Marseille-P299]